MSQLQQLGSRAATLGEVFSFLWQRKLWWMIPLFSLLILLGLLLVFAQASGVAPWLYPL